MESVITTVEGQATSGIRRASASLTILSVLWIVPHVVRRMRSRRISSTRFFTTKHAQYTPRATTRCGSARSCANPSSQHRQMLLRKSRTRLTKMTKRTLVGSNSHKTSSTSYLEEILVLTFTNAPDLYTASARFVVAFPLEYSPKVYQSVDRQ